jgi:hypothetical protein
MRKLLALALVAAACDRPPVDSTEDQRQQANLSHISGNVVVQSKARGNVVVLLFDAAHPPPPDGTGRPLSFTVIPQQTVFGNAASGDSGPFTAPYSFSLVAPGAYILKGFVDANLDFIPWYFCTGDVDQGDVGGAAVDPVTFLPRVISVDANTPADGVPVSFSDTATVPVDRPVFSPGPTQAITVQPSMTPTGITLTIEPVNQGVILEKAPIFLARFIDNNGDGQPDDANGDGIPDMWPQVIVRKVDKNNPLLDENDLDKNGIIDATGADYDHLNTMNGNMIPADGKPDAVVLAAAINPADPSFPLAPLLLDNMGHVKPQPTPVTKLPVLIKYFALDASDPAKPVPLYKVPGGQWAIYVIQETGQTWRVPNELMPGVALPLGLPEIGDQQDFISTAAQ